MSERRAALIDQVKQMSVHERITLVEEILATLENEFHNYNSDWVKEATSRLDAYRAGDLPAEEFADLLAKYRAS